MKRHLLEHGAGLGDKLLDLQARVNLVVLLHLLQRINQLLHPAALLSQRHPSRFIHLSHAAAKRCAANICRLLESLSRSDVDLALGVGAGWR